MAQGSISVSNEEVLSVRDAMRTLSRLVEALENGETEKFVLLQNNKLRAVLLSTEAYVELVDRAGGPDREA